MGYFLYYEPVAILGTWDTSTKKTQPLLLKQITLPYWIVWYHKPPIVLVAPYNFICYLFFPYLLSKC